jgi:hypothetical protein
MIGPALRNDKFHTGRVHPISEGSDHRQVGHAKEGVEFIFFQGLVAIRRCHCQLQYT